MVLLKCRCCVACQFYTQLQMKRKNSEAQVLLYSRKRVSYVFKPRLASSQAILVFQNVFREQHELDQAVMRIYTNPYGGPVLFQWALEKLLILQPMHMRQQHWLRHLGRFPFLSLLFYRRNFQMKDSIYTVSLYSFENIILFI